MREQQMNSLGTARMFGTIQHFLDARGKWCRIDLMWHEEETALETAFQGTEDLIFGWDWDYRIAVLEMGILTKVAQQHMHEARCLGDITNLILC